MALTIGVTGGIGSGKSTVCKVFEILGVPIFKADDTARLVLDNHEPLKQAIISRFGKDIYLPDGRLDRKKMASVIFNDPMLLSQVNQLVHPVVRELYNEWLIHHKTSAYIVHEAAILFESGFYKMMDYIIVVTASEEERIGRLMKRDGMTETMIRDRMKNQWQEEEKIKLADLIIENNNTRLIVPEIIHADYKLRIYGTIR
jgi:dephospho-CoA kinase